VNTEINCFDAIRVRACLWRLERPLAPRDTIPRWLFVGSFLLYLLVGQILQQFHAHDVDNYIFGADTHRAMTDLVQSHRQPSSGFAVSSAHPLFVLLLNPVAAVLARLLGGADLLAGLLLTHAAAATANVLLYVLLRRSGSPRALAAAMALVFALSTTQLLFGSIVETYSFIPVATLGLAWIATNSSSPWVTAPFALVPFGLNVTLAPYSLFCPPLLWLFRLRFGRWLRTTVAFLLGVSALAFVALLLQHYLYPDTNFFNRNAYHGYYDAYVHTPKTAKGFAIRMHELSENFFAFCMVAPRPVLLPGPARQSSFVFDKASTYSNIGWIVAIAWGIVVLAATTANVLTFRRQNARRRALLALSAGWLAGTFGLFTFYGVELMLPSEYWVAHLVLWVGLGVDVLCQWLQTRKVERHLVVAPALAVCAALLVLFGLAQAGFVNLLVRNYYHGPLLVF
jgi:hypothetical protein